MNVVVRKDREMRHVLKKRICDTSGSNVWSISYSTIIRYLYKFTGFRNFYWNASAPFEPASPLLSFQLCKRGDCPK